QKDEYNKSPEVSNEEDLSLQPKKVYDIPKCLQAAIASAMKSGLMYHLKDLLGFPVSPIYKLEVWAHMDTVNDPPIPSEVDDLWTERVALDQPLTYHGTHYHYLLNTIFSVLQVDGHWLQKLTSTMPLTAVIASPCSVAEFA
uniref:Uncharacterized protein n=1 Tax=Romanomermis culicivorax TaxID=13658 RepID=A0A915ILP1_ROMCU